MDYKDLIGKTIQEIEVNGYEVIIITTDGIRLEYGASDGGYSNWGISQEVS